MKQRIRNNIKNIYGWKTSRKVVVISVDDYGNVRLHSKEARARMDKAGLKTYNRFDAYDSLETSNDLEALFEALSSVKDQKNRHAMFTPFSLPCNIDFEKMSEENFEQYHYELLPETFRKLESLLPEKYHNTWNLWKEGIASGLMVPQFHGREHINLKIFEEKLDKKDADLRVALKNRSYTSIQSHVSTISPTAAFEFWNFSENERFEHIIKDGLKNFEKVFGYSSNHFNSPGGREHFFIHKFLKENGIRYIDTPFVKREHQNEGRYKRVFNYTGKKNDLGMTYLVRNVVFEPTDDRGFDWVQYSLNQVASAFFWKRPAIISSHRVNFCGNIDERNREKGISSLRLLLKKIVTKWPDVEFMSANELGELIDN